MAAGPRKRGQKWVVENVGEVWGGAELDYFGEDGGDGEWKLNYYWMNYQLVGLLVTPGKRCHDIHSTHVIFWPVHRLQCCSGRSTTQIGTRVSLWETLKLNFRDFGSLATPRFYDEGPLLDGITLCFVRIIIAQTKYFLNFAFAINISYDHFGNNHLKIINGQSRPIDHPPYTKSLKFKIKNFELQN